MMLRRALLTFAGIAVLAGCVPSSPAPSSPAPSGPGAITDADRKAFDEIRAAEIAAYSAGDAEKLIALITDDAVALPPNEPMIRGKQGARDFIRRMHEQFKISGEYTGAEVVAAAGDVAVERMTFRLTLQPVGGGAPIVDEGKGVHVYRRQADGTWKIALDAWNSNAPPPAAPPPPAAAK